MESAGGQKQWEWTNPWYDLRFTLFSPLCHLGVDLIPELRLNFTSVACEQREEALSATIYNVDLMERDCVNDLFSFLNFAFWALDEFCLGK
jgi:hypothetical protein